MVSLIGTCSSALRGLIPIQRKKKRAWAWIPCNLCLDENVLYPGDGWMRQRKANRFLAHQHPPSWLHDWPSIPEATPNGLILESWLHIYIIVPLMEEIQLASWGCYFIPLFTVFLHPRLVFSPDFYHQHDASQVRVASSAWKSAMEIFKDCSGRWERWKDDVFAKTEICEKQQNVWWTSVELPIGFTCNQHIRYQTVRIVQHQVLYL